MQTDLHTLQDTFRISMNAYFESAEEADEVTNMYHNRQYTQSQLATLANRGQPAETFNIIKLFGRLMLGYYSTVVNTVKVSPNRYSDVYTASLLNDVLDFTMQDNQMETEGDKVKLDGLLSGLMCLYEEVVETGEKDQFGRAIRRIRLSHVPRSEIAIDPISRLEDYSDARYLHRWKWISEEQLKKIYKGKGIEEKLKQLYAYQNHLLLKDAEFEKQYGNQFWGIYKRYNNYLVVHTIIEDDDGKRWSIHWCANTELSREEITYAEVRFPYRVHKLHTSDKTEYYGVFREVVESQKAINQALLKIQLMANTQKAFVQSGGVEDLAEFTNQFNRVNAVIPVKDLRKIKIENLTREVADQYTIIDKAFDRIQKVLGVNDSFLGTAFASDSGRKVKLQQNATTMSLRYVSTRLEQFYRLLGWDIVNLVKQYYTATQVLRITDESVGQRWIQLNQPLKMFSGRIDPNTRQPIMQYMFEEATDPNTGKPLIDDDGNAVIVPIPTQETEIAFAKVDLQIDTTVYNDEDEKNQLMIETVMSGNIGQALLQANPAGFFQMAALSTKMMKTKHSQDISDILTQTAQRIAGAQQGPPQGGQPDMPQATNQPQIGGKRSPKSDGLTINQPTTARERV